MINNVTILKDPLSVVVALVLSVKGHHVHVRWRDRTTDSLPDVNSLSLPLAEEACTSDVCGDADCARIDGNDVCYCPGGYALDGNKTGCIGKYTSSISCNTSQHISFLFQQTLMSALTAPVITSVLIFLGHLYAPVKRGMN